MEDQPSGGERPPWLDVDDLAPPERRGTPSRPRWVAAAAVVPWLVVALLLARPGAAGPTGDALPSASPRAAAPTTTPPADELREPAAALPDAGGAATITASGALVAVDEDEARAVAVVAARRWLTTVGPAAPSRDPAAGVYAEHLVVEGVDHPAPGAAVVTVRAIVLRVDGDAYDAVELRRVAVPLRFDATGAAPGGTPYLLPIEDVPAAPLEPAAAIDDPDLLLAAGEALAAVGFQDIAVHSLHRTSSWPLLVTADVRAGEAPPARVSIWLRPHLGRLVVAGTRPRAASPSHPSHLPSSPDAGAPADGGHPHDDEEVAP